MESKPAKAFTLGTVHATLFSKDLPDEVINRISSHLTRKEGGRLAQTHKKANEAAKENEDIAKTEIKIKK